ncbi:MAG: hydantoinase/oxoprolinase family protein [Gammaproteobacteria bacterium]
MNKKNQILLGIDTGGTFTDFVLFQNGELKIHKVLSTPKNPEKAILQGISDLGLFKQRDSNFDTTANVAIIHGSTVATNAVLERKGVRTVYIANKGLGDVLTIARQTRPELYAIQGPVVIPPVAKDLCLEANCRISATGETLTALTDGECEKLCDEIKKLKPDAVAINFLFSYLNGNDEITIAKKLPEDIFVSCSHLVLAEIKEYERGIATWLNSYVGPLVKGYIESLQENLPQAGISVMQSSGGSIAANQAGDHAVRMLLSGPAGGMAGAKYMADITSCSRILTFDMGGTSTDVAMIDKEIQLTTEGFIGDFPVAVPMVDMHTIGAGGGSIATIDSGGLLQVGPESAGAVPGPACYGNKGSYATVTDANLVLGRLQAVEFLGGNMKLDIQAAQIVIKNLASQLSLDSHETALGIIQLANEHMAQALRVMSVQRGLDPQEMSLVSFGGAGGLHVCALADSLSISNALVPIHGGVLSAFGMLVAPKARYLSHSFSGLVETLNYQTLRNSFETLEQQGITALQQEGVDKEDITITHEVDLRYAGQSSFITVPVEMSQLKNKNRNLQQAQAVFQKTHKQRYGHQIALPIEVVNIRMTLKSIAAIPEISNTIVTTCDSSKPNKISVHGFTDKINFYQRDSLQLGQKITGPALIVEQTATTFLDSGWHAEVVEMGNLLLKKIV